MREIIYREEVFQIVGGCMEVHCGLGKGHDEVIYKDALEVEFASKQIFYARERRYTISYKGVILPHSCFMDFVVMEKIVLEAKAVQQLNEGHVKQVLNYLAASKLRLGLLVNFGEDSLRWKRVVL